MGIFKSAIFNKAKGRIGNVVLVQSVDNEIIAKSVPTPSQKPPTEGQLAQRSLFQVILAFALGMKANMQILFASTGKRRSGFNSFMSNALNAAKADNLTDLPDILQVADVTNGPAFAEIPTLVGIGGMAANSVTIGPGFQFTSTLPVGDPRLTDKLCCLVVSPSLQLSKVIVSNKTRSFVDPDIQVTVFKAPDNYLAFYWMDATTGEVSNCKVAGVYNAVTGAYNSITAPI